MPRPQPDPDLVAETLKLLAAGVSLADAAEVAGVSASAVRKWAHARKKAALDAGLASARRGEIKPMGDFAKYVDSSPPPAHMAPPAPVEAVEVGDDLAAGFRGIMNRALKRSAAAEAAGNFSAAQKDSRDAVATAAIIARVEKQSAPGSISVTAAQFAASEADLDARLAALAEREGLRCADCNRALSVAWGIGGDRE